MSLDMMVVLSNVGIVVVSIVAIVADHHTINLLARLLLKVTKGKLPKGHSNETATIHHDRSSEVTPERPSTLDRCASDIGRSDHVGLDRLEREQHEHAERRAGLRR